MEKRKKYVPPMVVNYGDVTDVTGNQNSNGSDVPLGPNAPSPGNYYSIGK
jgi:hypothetical protein